MWGKTIPTDKAFPAWGRQRGGGFAAKKESQPRLAALGSPFQGKGLAWTLPPSYGRREYAASQTSHEEGLRYENAAFPHCHFERKREIFFVRGQAKDVRIAASGKHRAPSESEGRCFMQTALRKKTETGNEKDPSAALGMTKRGNASFHSFSTCCGSQPRLAALGSPFQGKGLAWTLPPSYGRRCPEGAEVGWGKRYPRHKAFLNGEGNDTRIPISLRGGGFAAKKEANPASLRSAAPSRGRGSRGRSPSFQRKGGECRFPHIVISSESEKSFSFAVRQRM